MRAHVVPLSSAPSRRGDSSLAFAVAATEPVDPPVSADQVRTVLAGLSAAVVHQQVVATAIGFLIAERRCTPRQTLGSSSRALVLSTGVASWPTVMAKPP